MPENQLQILENLAHSVKDIAESNSAHTGNVLAFIGVALGTLGWVFTLRRNRMIARKQFTLQIIIESDFNERFIEARRSALRLPHDMPIKANHNDLEQRTI